MEIVETTNKTQIKFYKNFTVNFRKWVDGEQTDEVEERTKALFVREVEGHLASKLEFGSLLLNKGVTLAEADAYFKKDVDYANDVRFVDVDGSDFYKVVLR